MPAEVRLSREGRYVVSENLGAWLRQQREARGWAKREMARQLIQAGRATGDTSMPGMDNMCHNIYRWERGQGGLTERYKLHYCKALGIQPGQFGADPAGSYPPVPAPGCHARPRWSQLRARYLHAFSPT